MIRVRISKNGVAVDSVDLEKTEILIGRGSDADVQLASEAVSRRHARLSKTNDGWQLADLGAANGVYVSSGASPPERIVIRQVSPAEEIRVESFVISFEEIEAEEANLAEKDDPFADTSLETRHTQFISMVDVLAAQQAAAAPMPDEPSPSLADGGATTAGTGASSGQATAAVPSEPAAAPPDPAAAPPASGSDTEQEAIGSQWWVQLTSRSGHKRTFALTKNRARVGSEARCEVRLPEGPGVIVELDRSGAAVELRRVSLWPFPRVQYFGKAVRSVLLQDQDEFEIGEFEVRIHLKAVPT